MNPIFRTRTHVGWSFLQGPGRDHTGQGLSAYHVEAPSPGRGVQGQASGLGLSWAGPVLLFATPWPGGALQPSTPGWPARRRAPVSQPQSPGLAGLRKENVVEQVMGSCPAELWGDLLLKVPCCPQSHLRGTRPCSVAQILGSLFVLYPTSYRQKNV